MAGRVASYFVSTNERTANKTFAFGRGWPSGRQRQGRKEEEEVLMEIIYFDYWKAKCCLQQLTRCLSRKPHGSS